LLPYYLLWSTAAAAFVLGALLHRWLYAKGFSKAQESAERWVKSGALGKVGRSSLGVFGVVRRELLLKEIRLFFRDTTQWSQLIFLISFVGSPDLLCHVTDFMFSLSIFFSTFLTMAITSLSIGF